jgi:uncharacterized protein with GYD domain
MRAFVLITVEVGQVREVRNHLIAEGIPEVAVVAGSYDLVAILQADEPQQVAQAVLDVIQRAEGVRDTVTLMQLE